MNTPQPNRHGTPIWYELMTTSPEAAARFYGAVVGWQTEHLPGPDGGYRRQLAAGQGVAGIRALAPEQRGAGPVWLGYVGVEDVDTSAARIADNGGAVHVPPTDIPGIGRFAMVADPQGGVFYVMRGASSEPSPAFSSTQAGHCGWHELATRDAPAALGFYGKVFGWQALDTLSMGEMGDYTLIGTAAGVPLGGVMPGEAGARPRWTFYFVVDGIAAATARIRAGGGTVRREPHQVPGDGWIVHGTDPDGADFALTSATY